MLKCLYIMLKGLICIWACAFCAMVAAATMAADEFVSSLSDNGHGVFLKIQQENPGASGYWTSGHNVDKMSGEVSWHAVSPWVRIETEQLLAPPYNGTEAALVIACNPEEEWALVVFTQPLPWQRNDVDGLVVMMRTRIKFDDKVEKVALSIPASGRKVLHFRHDEYFIEKMRRHNTVLLELLLYGLKPVYFQFSLKGATSITNSTRKSCRKK